MRYIGNMLFFLGQIKAKLTYIRLIGRENHPTQSLMVRVEPGLNGVNLYDCEQKSLACVY